jgi:murein DD-endopeptidase MepM/ murein hydrolase activator NlpD
LRAMQSWPSVMPSGRMQLGELARQTRQTIERLRHAGTRHLGRRALFLVVDLLVVAIVMALPFIGAAATQPAAQASVFSASVGSTTLMPVDSALVARAAPEARSRTISAGRAPNTVVTEGAQPSRTYTLSAADSLWTIANYYGLTAESIAFANGITDPYHLQLGQKIVIPPADGALYTVADGDTVDSVAARFKVAPAVIQDYNRLWLEPQNFGAGAQIFVPHAVLAALPLPPQVVATVITRPAISAPEAKAGGFLAWPVNGIITQYMWAGHTGVDIAAPFGTGLASSVNGAISQNGWVAVGGLHICVQSGNLEECYYHLSAAYLPVGTPVTAGQIVAAIGLTGVTTGPHVHWETKINGQFVNPLAVLQP